MTVTGGTTTNGGTFSNGANVTAGTLNNNATITGTVSSAGTFNNNATGTVSDLVTVTGGTTTNAGTFSNGANVTAGTLDNNATITGAVNSAGTFNNNVGGTSDLVTVTGTTTNSGTFSNGANVTGGTLNNNATLRGEVTAPHVQRGRHRVGSADWSRVRPAIPARSMAATLSGGVLDTDDRRHDNSPRSVWRRSTCRQQQRGAVTGPLANTNLHNNDCALIVSGGSYTDHHAHQQFGAAVGISTTAVIHCQRHNPRRTISNAGTLGQPVARFRTRASEHERVRDRLPDQHWHRRRLW